MSFEDEVHYQDDSGRWRNFQVVERTKFNAFEPDIWRAFAEVQGTARFPGASPDPGRSDSISETCYPDVILRNWKPVRNVR